MEHVKTFLAEIDGSMDLYRSLSRTMVASAKRHAAPLEGSDLYTFLDYSELGRNCEDLLLAGFINQPNARNLYKGSSQYSAFEQPSQFIGLVGAIKPNIRVGIFKDHSGVMAEADRFCVTMRINVHNFALAYGIPVLDDVSAVGAATQKLLQKPEELNRQEALLIMLHGIILPVETSLKRYRSNMADASAEYTKEAAEHCQTLAQRNGKKWAAVKGKFNDTGNVWFDALQGDRLAEAIFSSARHWTDDMSAAAYEECPIKPDEWRAAVQKDLASKVAKG